VSKRDSLQAELGKLRALEEEMARQETEALVGREEGPERAALMGELCELEASNAKMRDELEQFREMDPDLFEERRRLLNAAKEACTRWTDNIFTLQSHCSNVFGVSRADFGSSFEIPEDLDYI
jgi:predicted nuclease with TOPRIM domain